MSDGARRNGWLRLDSHYADDPAVIELDDDLARLLYIDGLCLAKRFQSGGFIHRGQLRRIAPKSGDADALAAALVAAGLWQLTDDPPGWQIRSWTRWNEEPEGGGSQSEGARLGNHNRWHRDRGIVDPECSLCIGTESPPIGVMGTDESDRGAIRGDVVHTPAGAGQITSIASDSTRREETRRDSSLASPSASPGEDGLRNAVLEICGNDPDDLTPSARGPLNRAVKELRDVGATPDEVRIRGPRFHDSWPQATLTPSALAKHWPTLAGGTNGTGHIPTEDRKLVTAGQIGAERAEWGWTLDAVLDHLVMGGASDPELDAATKGYEAAIVRTTTPAAIGG